VSTEWAVIAGLVVTTALIRASGPLALGGRRLPPRALGVIALLAPALLAGLVVTGTFAGEESEIVLDERAAGLAGAGGVLAMRGPVLLAMLVAVGVTAAARAL